MLTDARAAAKFARVESFDKGSVCYKVLLPGHHGKRYLVLLRKEFHIVNYDSVCVLTGECLLDTGSTVVSHECPSGPRMCYHIRAAIIAVGASNSKTVSFCADEQTARKIQNLGGKAFCYSKYSQYQFYWAVAKNIA